MANLLKKKFNISSGKLRQLSGWTLSIIAVTVTLGFVSSEVNSVKCRSLSINIDDAYGYEFVKPADIKGMLSSASKQPVGKRLSDINIGMLEKLISTNSCVAAVEVFSTIDGTLHFDIRQRRPVIRIINQKDEHFYVDDKGEFMPVSAQFTANVVVANGFIFNTYTERKIQRKNAEEDSTDTAGNIMVQLYDLAMFLSRNEFWNAQVEQVYVNEFQKMELIPRVGDHVILFGTAENMERKFEKLLVFYKEGLNKTGWNGYEKINLQFEGQVVCTRRK